MRERSRSVKHVRMHTANWTCKAQPEGSPCLSSAHCYVLELGNPQGHEAIRQNCQWYGMKGSKVKPGPALEEMQAPWLFKSTQNVPNGPPEDWRMDPFASAGNDKLPNTGNQYCHHLAVREKSSAIALLNSQPFPGKQQGIADNPIPRVHLLCETFWRKCLVF